MWKESIVVDKLKQSRSYLVEIKGKNGTVRRNSKFLKLGIKFKYNFYNELNVNDKCDINVNNGINKNNEMIGNGISSNENNAMINIDENSSELSGAICAFKMLDSLQ